jgi:hypothetical protein
MHSNATDQRAPLERASGSTASVVAGVVRVDSLVTRFVAARRLLAGPLGAVRLIAAAAALVVPSLMRADRGLPTEMTDRSFFVDSA